MGINGDGYDDLIVGVPDYGPGVIWSPGRTYIYFSVIQWRLFMMLLILILLHLPWV